MVTWMRSSAIAARNGATARTLVDLSLWALLGVSVIGFVLGMSPHHISCTTLDPPICRSSPGHDLLLAIVSAVGGLLIIGCKRMLRRRSDGHRHGAISDVHEIDAEYRR